MLSRRIFDHHRWLVALAVLSGCSALTNLDHLSDGLAHDGDDAAAAAHDGSPTSDGSGVGEDGGALNDANAKDDSATDGGGGTSDSAASDAACTSANTQLQVGTIVANVGNSDVPWTTTNGALTPNDSVFATATLTSASDKTLIMIVRGFGFALPAQATITSATVEVIRKGVDHEDDSLRLVQWSGVGNPTYGAVDRANGNAWPTVLGPRTYSADPFNWGMALTPAVVNSANFGVALSAQYKGTTAGDPFVDAVRILIGYCN